MQLNKRLERIARDLIKEDLKECTEEQHEIFKRMYAPHNLNLDINETVEQIPNEKLQIAMSQVENTVKKNKNC